MIRKTLLRGGREKFRREGLGGVRAPHPPEHNLIQRPGLMRRLRDTLGIRQAHLTPALAENIQPVIVVDDLSRRASKSVDKYMTGLFATPLVGDGLTHPAASGILNPSGRWCHVTRCKWLVTSATSFTAGFGRTSVANPLPAGYARDYYWNLRDGLGGRYPDSYPSSGAGGAFPVSTSTMLSGTIQVHKFPYMFEQLVWDVPLDVYLAPVEPGNSTSQGLFLQASNPLITNGFHEVCWEYTMLQEESTD